MVSLFYSSGSRLEGDQSQQTWGVVLSAARSQLVAQFSKAGSGHRNDSLWALTTAWTVGDSRAAGWDTRWVPGLLSTTERHSTASFFLLRLSRSPATPLATVRVQKQDSIMSIPSTASNEQRMIFLELRSVLAVYWFPAGAKILNNQSDYSMTSDKHQYARFHFQFPPKLFNMRTAHAHNYYWACQII